MPRASARSSRGSRAGDQDLRELAASRRREGVHRDAGGVRGAHRDTTEILSPRVGRDEDAAPGEGPEHERQELEDERRQQEAAVEPAEAIRCGLEGVDDATPATFTREAAPVPLRPPIRARAM